MLDRALGSRLRASRTSTLLLGPRQVGKSTLCRSLHPDRIIDLADEGQFLGYAKDPGRMREELAAMHGRTLVLIDEVQRVPSLLNTVQTILDDPDQDVRFLLTGSSARKLKRGQANLLPGRIILEHLDPLLWFELGDAFDLSRALQVGMLPGIYLGGEESIPILETYVEVYLREEIRAEALTKNVGGYARFLDVAAVTSGQWLNYSKIASDSEIPKETIRRFVSILEDTLLLFRLPAFRPRTRTTRRVSQRDRFLLFDVGVRNALLSLHRKPVTPDQLGPTFEHWLSLQVLHLDRALRKGWTISSYRTEAGAEVDLVIERGDDIVGLEIKASKNAGRSDARGLLSLEEMIGKVKPLRKRIAYLGTTRRRLDNGTEAIPFLEALEELRAEE
jgi:predicted AAA+ superfamily ATPase